MNAFLWIGKGVTLCFWGAVVLSLFSVFPDRVASLLGWAAVAVLVLHVIEVVMFASLLSTHSLEPKYDKMRVLIFGIFHVLPLLLKEKARLTRQSR